jgi:TolB-like protein
MKNSFLIVLLALFCCSFLHAESDKPIITVLDFDSSGIAEAEMQTTISILSSALFKTELFTVIDVSQRETVLKELEFSLSGCSDESCMLEVGKMLSAEAIVVGSIGRIGNKYVLSAKMLETETARTISSADALYPDIDSLLENIYQIADELAFPYKEKQVTSEDTHEEALSEHLLPSENAELADINIPAITTLSGGIVSLGTGAYFLAVSIPLIFDYLGAKSNYEAATTDITTLWNTYETARQTAVDGNANTNFIIGASFAAAGTALTVVSMLLFNVEEPESDIQISFLPVIGAATLSFKLNPGEETK